MYPLLISAASSVASTLIDKWAAAREAKAAATAAPAVNFASVLEKSGVSATDVKIATLRQRLLDSPEVHTLLASADPSKQPAISLGADGTLSARTADGRTTAITLSSDSAAAARELATLRAARTAPAATTTAALGKILPPVTFPMPL
jgi:hypothetical protein